MTRRNYASSVDAYRAFTAARGHRPFPATVETILQWLASIAPKVKPDTAKSYLNSLRSYHTDQRWDTTIFSDPHIDLLIRGAKRCFPEKQKRTRLPLTQDILLQIIQTCSLSLIDNLNIYTAICVGFSAFLRAGEFTWDSWDPASSPSHSLSRQHVTFNEVDGSVTLGLPSSKTDPYRLGVDIHLASSSSTICAVCTLKQLFTRHPLPQNHALFNRPMGPFSKSHFVDKMHEFLLRIGTPTHGFSGHSLRKGAAVSAAARGISKENIKLMGRWKSDAVQVYIDEVDASQRKSNLLALNTQLQITPSLARHLASASSHNPTTRHH